MSRSLRPSTMLAAMLAVAALSGTAGATPSHGHPANGEAALAELRAVEHRQGEAFARRDLDGSVEPYADDAIMVSPGQPRVEGKAGIRAALGALFADKAFAIAPRPVRQWVSGKGDMIVALGTFDFTVTDPATGKPTTMAASNLTAWQKDRSGNWKIVADYNGFGGGAPQP